MIPRGVFMGQVAVVFRLLPSEIEHYEKMKLSVKERLSPYRMEEKDIGFGLKALYATFIIEDSSGGADMLEEKLRGLEGVGQVDIEGMNRI